MKFCPVIPPGNEWALPLETKAFFCFANAAYEDTSYAAFYAARAKEGKLVVMDCPIYEGFKPLNPAQLSEMRKAIDPTFLIVPDVRHSKYLTQLNFDEYYKYHLQDDYDQRIHNVWTGVLQGMFAHEVMDLYCWYVEKYGLQRLALPKDLAPRIGLTRTEIVKWLETETGYKVSWHFLGANYPYEDEKRVPSNVLSCDTAEPFNAADRWYSIADGLDGSMLTRASNWWKLRLNSHGANLFDSNVKCMENWFHA